MIKIITKRLFVCDMCGHELVPKDAFELAVNLEDGTKIIQICPGCQAKLRTALEDKSNDTYNKYFGERRKSND